MLPITGNSKIKTRQMTGKNELERSFKSLSKLMSKNTTVSQSAVLSTRSSVEAATNIYENSKDLLGRSLAQQDTNNKILQQIIRTLQEKDVADIVMPDSNKKRNNAAGKRSRANVRPSSTAAIKTPRVRIEPRLVPVPTEQATRTQAPRPTATQQQPTRPGRIVVGGGLEYDTATNRYHDPRLPGNRNMVKNADALSRGAVPPTPEQIQEARAARAASRVSPPPSPTPPAPPPPPPIAAPPAELRANPAERLVPSAPTAPGALQRADEAVGRALESPRGRVAAGGISILLALPMVIDAYNEISTLPTTMPRNEYEQRVTTIILQLITAGIALPYIGAVIGGLIGTAIFPGIGTIAGLGAGIVGGAVASYTADEMVRELTGKLVAHFYDRASRQDSDGVHINYYNQYLAQQRALPQNQRGLPDDIEELQKLLIAATVTARSGGTALRPVAAATANSIRQKIQMLREAEQQGARQVSSLEAADASLLTLARNDANEGPSKADTADAFAAMDRFEYRNLTFEATTITFEGDIAQEQQSTATRMSGGGAGALATPASAPVATRMMAPSATSESGGGSTTPISSVGGGGGMTAAAAPGAMASSGAVAAPSRFEPGRSEQTSEDFMTELNAVATRLGVQSNDLLAVMRSETGGTLNPSIPNAAGSGAVGLIQFMPATARGLGTSTEELSRMSQTQQLRYVEAYFRQTRLPRGASAGMIYAHTFMPAAARNNPDQLAVRGTNYYSANQGLDVNDDGIISIDDLDRFLRGERRGRTSGQRVSSTPQTGSAMAGSSTSTEAERMRRLQSSSAIIQQLGVEQNSSRSSVSSGQTATSTEDVALNYRLRQAIA